MRVVQFALVDSFFVMFLLMLLVGLLVRMAVWSGSLNKVKEVILWHVGLIILIVGGSEIIVVPSLHVWNGVLKPTSWVRDRGLTQALFLVQKLTDSRCSNWCLLTLSLILMSIN